MDSKEFDPNVDYSTAADTAEDIESKHPATALRTNHNTPRHVHKPNPNESLDAEAASRLYIANQVFAMNDLWSTLADAILCEEFGSLAEADLPKSPPSVKAKVDSMLSPQVSAIDQCYHDALG
jgi:hypothetical protein